MDKKLMEKLKKLRREIHVAMNEKLTYPKSVADVLREKPLSENEVGKIKDCIEECITLVDAKFIEFLDGLEDRQ